MTARSQIALSFVAALAGVAVGCGGSDDGGDSDDNGEAGRIEMAVSGYGEAIADGDAARACALLSPAGQRQLRGQQSAITQRQLDCQAAARSLHQSLSEAEAQSNREIVLEQIEVSGDTATARVVDGNGVKLVRSGDDWLIAGLTP